MLSFSQESAFAAVLWPWPAAAERFSTSHE
jgi:hypothetical protein